MRVYNRRSFLKIVASAGVVLVGAQAGCQQRETPASGVVRQSGEEVVSAKPAVAIIRGDDPGEMVRRAVALAGGLDQVIPRSSTVLIKPNLTIPSASGLGNVTDSRVVQAAIELCQQAGAGQILIGDGSGGGDTEEIMRQAGYEPILEATGARFIDFNKDEVVTRRLADPAGLSEYSFSKTPIDAPVLISLAVLKVHNSAIVTLSCKNLMGITARQVYGRPRQELHNTGVQRVIADVVRIRTPDFAIIDGLVGLEGDGPMNGTSVPMNLVIAGRNPVTTDAVGAAVMGFDPQKIEHLSLLAQKGVGEIDLSKINVKGSAIADVKRTFRR